MEWLTPSTVDELADAVARRPGDAAPLPVTGARAAPDRLPPGAEPPGAVLSTSELAGVTEHRPRDLTVTAAAGTRMSELLAATAEEGGWLPFGGPALELSVGGAVACGLPGPFDAGHGDLRRQLLGCELVTWSGDRTRWGRGVMKNVAGYGLTRAVAGSFGRLGVVLGATFRLWPAPDRRRRVRLRSADGDDALTVAGRTAVSDFDAEVRPDAVVWRRRPGDPTAEDGTEVWLIGTEASVELRLERLRAWAAEAGVAVAGAEPGPTAAREADALPSGAFGRRREDAASAGWLSAGRDGFVGAARAAEETLGDDLLALEGYPLSGELRVAWSGGASGRRSGGLPGDEVDAPLRMERGGRDELARAEARRAEGVRRLERRVVEAAGGRPRDWLSGYL